MERLIEQLTDEGDVLQVGVRLGSVYYHLAVYQHFSEVEDEPMLPSFEVEGRITPRDRLDLSALLQRRTELTLRLADGRVLDFLMADSAGAIRSTGRGLYRA